MKKTFPSVCSNPYPIMALKLPRPSFSTGFYQSCWYQNYWRMNRLRAFVAIPMETHSFKTVSGHLNEQVWLAYWLWNEWIFLRELSMETHVSPRFHVSAKRILDSVDPATEEILLHDLAALQSATEDILFLNPMDLYIGTGDGGSWWVIRKIVHRTRIHYWENFLRIEIDPFHSYI